MIFLKEKKNNKILVKIGDFIVNYRYLFLIIFLILIIICAININNVSVNYDITSYLGDETETKKGIKLMEEEFGALNEIQVMLTDISYEDALNIKENISSIKNVTSVSFDSSENYFKDENALFVIELANVDAETRDEVVSEITNEVSDEKYYMYIENGEDVVEGMNIILIIAIIIIVLVLLFTTTSYFEIVLAFIVFGISILLNMGSNFIFGEISYITKSIAIILQLCLSLDYFIIFMNHYMKEKNDTDDQILAVKKTVTKSIPEICASSLTTIAGLLALVFMQLKIGADIGIILSKGIICSLITVIFLLPLLIILCSKLINKTEHKNYVPNISKLANFIVNSRKFLLPVFVLLLVISCLLIPNYEYVYNVYSVKANNGSDNQITLENIEETFGSTNRLVVLVENEDKDYSKELELTNKLLENSSVIKATSLGSYQISEDLYLGTKLKYQEFAKLFQLSEKQASSLYLYYIQNNQINISNSEVSNYAISIIDLLEFLNKNKEKLELTSELENMITSYYTILSESKPLLESDDYSRIILELKAPVEGTETYELLDKIRDDTEEYYDNVVLVGESVSARDLSESFSKDNTIITLVTILFIALILFVTFRSLSITALLILTIEGSILLTFGLATLLNQKIFFISYIIVSAIQMGATIDYAIVLTNRFLQLRTKINKKEALVGTIKDSLPTIVTSGFILTIAGLLIGFIASSGVVSSIGIFLGFGTLISMLITIFILPAILYAFDSVIIKKKIV